MLTFTTNKTADFTLLVDKIARCAVPAGSFTVTLPLNPSENDEVGVFLRKTNVGVGSNFVTILANQSIFGIGTTMKLYVEGDYVQFKYHPLDQWVMLEDGRKPHVVVIEDSTTVYNNAGLVVATGPKVTIRRAGTYQVNGNFGGATTGPPCGVDVTIRRNGSPVARGQGVSEATTGFTTPAVTAAGVIVCAEGDELSTTVNASNGPNGFRFSIAELSLP